MKIVQRLSLVILLLIAVNALAEQDEGELLQFPYSIENHQLTAVLDIDKHTIDASDLLTLKREIKKQTSLDLLLRSSLNVTEVKINDNPVEFTIISDVDPSKYEDDVTDDERAYYSRTQGVQVSLTEEIAKLKEINLEIVYAGVIDDKVASSEFSREYVTDQITGVVSRDGIYLGANAIFYPTLPKQIFTYSLEVTVQEPFQCITEGAFKNAVSEDGLRTETWVCEHPMDSFHIIGGQYQVSTIEHNGIEISTYFFPEQADLSERYLDACKGYIDLYTELIDPYPFEKFVVVDNFFASGYGMPSFTLLGSQVLRLPFIIYTSLGHEICHNWWGNSVYVDYESGNWCEGLTVYCADYLYKERKSQEDAQEYRVGVLRDYSAYTGASNDFPLVQFRERHNPAQRAVGYGKGAMTFHMLRKYVGEDDFWRSLRRFKHDNIWTHASWADVRKAFEKESALKLRWFFDQWLTRTGAPEIAIADPMKQNNGEFWEVTFTLNQMQAGEPYVLDIPVVIHGEKQDAHLQAGVREKSETITLKSIFEPTSFSVDPNFDIFRRLALDEVAPTLADVFGKSELVIVLPGMASDSLLAAYQALAEELMPRNSEAAKIVSDREFFAGDIKSGSVIFLGKPSENQAIPAAWLTNDQWQIFDESIQVTGNNYDDAHTSFFAVERSPENPEIAVGYFCAFSAEDIPKISRKLRHYGKYSYLVFEAEKKVLAGNWKISDSPLTYQF